MKLTHFVLAGAIIGAGCDSPVREQTTVEAGDKCDVLISDFKATNAESADTAMGGFDCSKASQILVNTGLVVEKIRATCPNINISHFETALDSKRHTMATFNCLPANYKAGVVKNDNKADQ